MLTAEEARQKSNDIAKNKRLSKKELSNVTELLQKHLTEQIEAACEKGEYTIATYLVDLDCDIKGKLAKWKITLHGEDLFHLENSLQEWLTSLGYRYSVFPLERDDAPQKFSIHWR